jgi:toluene monooxygenase system ferredoxin subunit
MPPMGRKPLCRAAEVPVNSIKQFESQAGAKVCVINAGDRFFACQAACPHQGVALCDGVFDGDVLTCLEHLWQWSLRSGGEPRGLAERPLQMYELEVEGDAVYISEVSR